MRFLIATFAAFALLLTSSIAGAYEMRMSLKPGSKDPSDITVGESFVYQIFLDTTNTVGDSRITLFSASITFNPLVVAYDRVNSFAEDDYPLYYPKVSKTQPATWLVPITNPLQTWPAPPPGTTQINVDFIEVNLNNTVANDTNLLIAEVAFNAIAPGSGNPTFSFANGGNIFSVEQIDITGKAEPYLGPETIAAVLVDGATITVPEPGVAGLALGALGAVGVLAGRLRRR